MEERDRIREINKQRKNIEEPGVTQAIIKNINMLQEVATQEKAGYLLRNLTIDQWNSATLTPFSQCRIGIISNFNCNEIEYYLRTNLLAERIVPDFYRCEYNQYMWDLINHDSALYAFNPDVTLCILDEHIFLEKLPSDWLSDDFETVSNDLFSSLVDVFNSYFRKTASFLVLNTIVLGRESYDSIIDYRSKMRLSRLIHDFNVKMTAFFESHKTGLVIDTHILLQERNCHLRNTKMSAYAQQHFSHDLLCMLAKEQKKIIRSIMGFSKKCLVLDCDNTLWGGIVGDDGINGIQLGGNHEGESYARFQGIAKKLGKQGVILAINSKNDAINTDRVFNEHPDAALDLGDFSIQRVNWSPKHENLDDISRTLNISSDHMVFVDDSDFECNMVSEFMPSVSVLQLSGNPEEYAKQLLSPGWFNILEISEEDRSRGKKYKAESRRNREKSKYSTIDEYLHSLSISVQVMEADGFSVPRIAQMTQRTNQFNFTTERLNEQQVKNYSDNDNWIILAVKVEDKFGDYGIVGALFIERMTDKNNGISWHIRNFLLSCRVFARGIETSVLNRVLLSAKENAVEALVGYFTPSQKNTKYSNFYLDNGFTQNASDDTNITQTFIHPISSVKKMTASNPAPWIEINQLVLIQE